MRKLTIGTDRYTEVFALAITKLEEALMWLRKRMDDRVRRGVEGSHNV